MGAPHLYDDDIVTWAEQQVAALRALAARPDLSDAADWAHVIEGIESSGRSEWKGVVSQLRNAFVHIIKGFCDPDSLSRLAWAAETGACLGEARADYRPSMARIVDLDEAWRQAFRRAADELRPYGVTVPPGIPARCPFTLDEVLGEAFTYDLALRRLYEGLTGQSPADEDPTP